jgi:rsbT co-antagonist protein RsbR
LAAHRGIREFDDDAVRARLSFFRIEPEDLRRLAAMRALASEMVDGVVQRFYEHLLSQPETRDFLDDPELVRRLKRKQTQYFLQMFDGKVDGEYVRNRVTVGATHARLGVHPQWYIGAFANYLQLVHEQLRARPGTNEGEVHADLSAVEKLMHFDASLAIDAYIDQHLDAIHRQQAAIRELSSPVIRVFDRVLLLPLVGTIDSLRAQHVMESALVRIGEEQAKVMLLDIAGVAVVDTQVADYLLKTTAAVRLLGAQTVITGISPQVARTMVELGVDLSSLHTRNKLSDGLELALSIVGKQVVPRNP